MKRGDVYIIDLSDSVGSEQRGTRPGVVVQNNAGNFTSDTLIVVPMASKKSSQITHVEVKKGDVNIKRDSTILCEQIRVIDKSRLKNRILTLPKKIMAKVDEGIKNTLALS